MNDGVEGLIADVEDSGIRSDSRELIAIMATETREVPRVWNTDTIGFGVYRYRYESGQEGEFFKIGFSPRKKNITIYVMSGLGGFDDVLARLGTHTASKATVKIKRLADINPQALRELISECVRHLDLVERDLGAIPRMSDIPPRLIS